MRDVSHFFFKLSVSHWDGLAGPQKRLPLPAPSPGARGGFFGLAQGWTPSHLCARFVWQNSRVAETFKEEMQRMERSSGVGI